MEVIQDSLITMDEVKSIVEGKITDWSQLKGSSQTGPITLVFDNANSSNLNFVMSKFNLKSIQKLRITSAGSNKNVIDEIKKNPLSLGFIGVNWISDGHDALAVELSKGIRVLGVSKSSNPASVKEYYQPFQNGLELKNYPLSRDVYIIIREGYAGLGSGMINLHSQRCWRTHHSENGFDSDTCVSKRAGNKDWTKFLVFLYNLLHLELVY